jgi:hypothetical protein
MVDYTLDSKVNLEASVANRNRLTALWALTGTDCRTDLVERGNTGLAKGVSTGKRNWFRSFTSKTKVNGTLT